MKKLLVTFLGIAFLLPALASAGSYCVAFPTTGENGWTKRDNDIGVKFQYTYDYEAAEKDGFKSPYSDAPVSASTGSLKGSNYNPSRDDYTTYDYGTRDLCIYNNAPDFGKIKGYRLSHYVGRSSVLSVKREYVPFDKVFLDVRWGGDCALVSVNGNGDVIGNHKFEIYRREGDIVNPFNCKRK